MRILVVSPYLPPAPGGVSDHSARLIAETAARGIEVEVATFTRGAQLPAGVKAHVIGPDPRDRRAFERALLKFAPDRIFVAYTPLAFAPKRYGIAPRWPFLLRRWSRLTGAPVYTYAHESHYPVRPSAKGVLIGLPHFLQFCVLAQVSRGVMFSHWASKEFWRKTLPWLAGRFSVVPVFSNISPIDAIAGVRERLNIPGTGKIALYFGGAHDMNRLDFVLSAFASLRTKGFRLVLAGVTREEAERRLRARLPGDVTVLGYLPAQDISALYQEAELVLAPFGEGINSRRGSAMASFAHGKPTVSTRGWCTGSDHPWAELACLAKDRDEYSTMASALAANPAEAKRLGAAAGSYYEQHFSPAVVTDQILEKMRLR